MITITLAEQEYVDLCKCFEAYIEGRSQIMEPEVLERRTKLLQKLMQEGTKT